MTAFVRLSAYGDPRRATGRAPDSAGAPPPTPALTGATPATLRGSRPHIVFLDHVARLSGGELALLRTIPALGDTVQITVVLAEDGPLADLLRGTGADVIVLPLAAIVRETPRASGLSSRRILASATLLIRYVQATSQLIQRLDADIVHTNSLKSALYGGLAGRLAGVPVVWHVRDRIAPDYLPWPTVLLVRLLSWLLPSAVIANSRATLETVPGPFRGTRAVVSSPVVLRNCYSSEAGQIPLVVGIVGRLAEWKGQRLFLTAFAQAFRGTSVRGRLVGSALFGEESYEQGLHDLARELRIEDQIDFAGFCSDVHLEMSAMAVVVHCSIVPEPFGQVVVEAMAAGRPVIAAAEGGPLDIVTDGVDGILVPPRDPALLAQALTVLLADPDLRQRLGTCGRRTAMQHGPQVAAARILDVYRRLLTQ